MPSRFSTTLALLLVLLSASAPLAKPQRRSRPSARPKAAAAAGSPARPTRRSPAAEAVRKRNSKDEARARKSRGPGAAAGTAARSDRPSADRLEKADRAYARKSYALALPGYRAALARKEAPEKRVPDVELRVARCLAQTNEWDAALQEGQRAAARYPGAAWESRARALLMEFYLKAPHDAWKVGERYFRGSDVPEVEGDAGPERVDLSADDARKAVAQGEQAWVRYEQLTGKELAHERADHAADLARVVDAAQFITWALPRRWAAPGDPIWELDPGAPYDPSWPPPRKVLQLYLAAERAGTPAQKPLARLRQAFWLRDYHSRMRRIAWTDEQNGERRRVPYPYQDRSPYDVVRSIIRDFPDDPETEHARVLIPEWLNDDGKYAEALAQFRRFVLDRPKSRWADNARAGIAEITRVRLDVQPPRPQPPGKKAELYVDARSVKSVKCRAYRVKLSEMLRDGRVLLRPKEGISDLFARLGRTAGVKKFAEGEPVNWKAPLPTKNDYAPYSGPLETPLTRNGAYLVELDGGEVRSAVLLVISDLAAIQIVDEERATALVVNAGTGAPVPDATVLFREIYPDAKDKNRVSAGRVTTGADGLAERKRAGGKRETRSLLAAAWKGDRYAFTGAAWRNGKQETGAISRAFVYTDRPVYRPDQTVYYRALLAEADPDGQVRPAKGKKARVRIFDPKGVEIASETVAASEWGSVNGKVQLAGRPPLGDYSIQVGWDRDNQGGAGGFRVEEYKKPEFEVKVKAGDGAARVGDPLKIRIAARYYFGGPAARAKVKYRVTRSEWVPGNPFHEPYSYLYSTSEPEREREGDDLPWTPIEEEEAAAGTALTNAAGEVSITVPTALKDPRLTGRHLQFSVTAEVTDASRRTIEGSGEVHVLATQFNAFLKLRQGFYSTGDRLQADVRTLDANGAPVSVQGTVRVFRLTAGGGRLKREEVHQEPLRTDEQGRATFARAAARDGSYEVRFEARDAREQLVSARERAWIAGEGAGAGVFHNRHVQLVPERTTYRPGQTARLLVAADEPNTTFLLTQEAGTRLLDRRVVRMTGRSRVIEIPLKRAHVPDVVIAVTGVRDRDLFRLESHLYVPPAEQLLDVQVSPDRERYKPGERAAFRIRARDVEGRPVRAEVSVGIVDASLFYIDTEHSGSLAGFFYSGERDSSLDARESLSQGFEALHEDTQPKVKVEPRPWEFPRGLGKLAGERWLELARDNGKRMTLAEAASRRRQDLTGAYPFSPHSGLRAAYAPASVAAEPAKSPAEGIRGLTGPPGMMGGGMGGEGRPPAPLLRKNFADTALWLPAVVTDASGEASVRVEWPDNLTRWRAAVRGWTQSAQVGEATADTETKKDLLVRLQAPRFFVERDRVVLSANVHNDTDRDQRIRVTLHLDGNTLVPASAVSSGEPAPRPLDVPRADLPPTLQQAPPPAPAEPKDAPEVRWVDVPKGSRARLDWWVRAEHPGQAKVRVAAEGAGDGDAVEMSFPVLVHGVEKLVVKGGSMLMRPGEKPGTRTAKLALDLPTERAPDSGELVVQVSPSVGAMMLDALPYLVDYPYGCVEQTMSRFLPCVVVARTLSNLGVDLPELKKRAAREAARLKAATPQDRPANSGYSYPEGAPGLQDIRKAMQAAWSWRAEKSPVYDPAILKKMEAEGLARLKQFQHKDGGWGWWKDDESDLRITAYVVRGLLTGRAAGLEAPSGMLGRGLFFLNTRFRKLTDLHDLACAGWVLSMESKHASGAAETLAKNVYPKRDKLTAYGLALLAIALKRGGRGGEAKVCVENLQNTARIDRAAGTCNWTRSDGAWWSWYNNDVETAAACLRALDAVDPKSPLAPMVVRWLSNNRRGGAWDSTRETAFTVEALAEYVRLNRELDPDCTVTVQVGGQFRRTFHLTAENALMGDDRLVVPAKALGSGPQTVTVTRTGRGSVYYAAYLRYFTLQEGIPASGNEIRVRRRYFRLTRPAPGSKAPVTWDGCVRTRVRTGERLTSGDLLEVELLIESKNAYEHLVFEDMKPAGCEPVDLRSGERYAHGLCSNMELRDEKVAFFITQLPQGKRMIAYRVRAEIPGTFHVLPLNGCAMYAPEVRCLSEERYLGIDDATAEPHTAQR